MTKNLIENKRYTLTRYCCMGLKLSYQITQKTHGDLTYDYVVLMKNDLKQMLKKIEEDE